MSVCVYDIIWHIVGDHMSWFPCVFPIAGASSFSWANSSSSKACSNFFMMDEAAPEVIASYLRSSTWWPKTWKQWN